MAKVGTVCERILSFGISFMFSLLEDPNVWRSDFAFEEPPASEEESKQDVLAAERLCQEVLFSQANTMKIFSALTRKYLVYT